MPLFCVVYTRRHGGNGGYTSTSELRGYHRDPFHAARAVLKYMRSAQGCSFYVLSCCAAPPPAWGRSCSWLLSTIEGTTDQSHPTCRNCPFSRRTGVNHENYDIDNPIELLGRLDLE